jgi:helicase
MTASSDSIIAKYSALVLYPSGNSEEYHVKFQAFKGRSITHARPSLIGSIQFHVRSGKARDLFRIFKFGYFEKNSKKFTPLHPDLAKTLFSNSEFILLDEKVKKEFKKLFFGFLEDFNLSKELIPVERCPSCAEKDQTTILRENNRYRAYQNKFICVDCALEEVRRELRSRKIHVDSTIDSYLYKILKESRNVDAVLKIFSGEQKVGAYTLVAKEIPSSTEVKALSVKDTHQLNPLIRSMLLTRDITHFMPIQSLSLESSLLEGNNLLAVAATSGGKTLIGEMAALTKIIERKKKAIYCVPLVALANTKYDELQKIYASSIPQVSLGLRVGRTRMKIAKRTHFKDTKIKGKNFIVGTYEGIDKLLRSGINLEDIGCIIIDEIQTLGEKERGPILDGLIARLRVLSKKAQVIGLSATIGNPEEFAGKLQMQLVHYKGKRPTPLEKHVLLAFDELNKRRIIKELILEEKQEYRQQKLVSQTIVFTNSRRKTTELASYLQSNHVRAAAYHSGIPYHNRRTIENQFTNGKLDAVVATYALGAGVDFPASTVIFESVLMGIDVLSANTYNQMAGRAGRLGKHKRGRAIFVSLPTPPTARIAKSEFEIAVALSAAALEEIIPDYSEDDSEEQVLATVCFLGKTSIKQVKEIYDLQIGNTSDFETVLDQLNKFGLIEIDKTKEVLYPTKLGKAAAVSFLKPSEVNRIVKLLERQIPPRYIVARMLPFENVFHSKKLQAWLERTFRSHISNRFFNGPILDLLRGETTTEVIIDPNIEKLLVRWSQKIFDCNCEDMPYCNHGLEKLSRGMIKLRINRDYSPQDISRYIMNEYSLFLYPGDVLRWMETVIHLLEGIARVSTVIGEKCGAWELVKKLEDPKRFKLKDDIENP